MRRKKMNIKEKKKNMKLQPYLDFWVSEIEMDFSCPACVLLWCLSVPLCLFPLFLCLSFSVSLLPKQPNQAAPFVLSFLPFFPNSLFTLRLPMPCFPYFGMSMCYLLTLCMNDNMSVYSYRESYPIPLVLTKKMV